jgi:uncharacterized protein YndB with AHSA1/START domain
MTVIKTEKDAAKLTLTFVAEFDASAERVWQVWEDPRLLERWWGPPTWPATFNRHEFTVGGESRYFMTGPEGERAHGYWRITVVDPPRQIAFEDGFADDDGEPLTDDVPSEAAVKLEPLDGGRTRMTIVSQFASKEQLNKMLEMGMEEGMREALGQIDALLAK